MKGKTLFELVNEVKDEMSFLNFIEELYKDRVLMLRVREKMNGRMTL
jgi:hypothetical protein